MSLNILSEIEVFLEEISSTEGRLKLFAQKVRFAEAAVRSCSVKKVFLKISQNTQNICARVSKKETLVKVFSCEFLQNF